MTTLYRSPTVAINGFEWHIAVVLREGRVYRRFLWRPVSRKAVAWQPIDKWPGHKPKYRELKPLDQFRAHAKRAERYEAER